MDETLPFLSSYGLHHPGNGHVLLAVVQVGEEDETVLEFVFAPSTNCAMIYGVSIGRRATAVSLLMVPAGKNVYYPLVLETGDTEAARAFVDFLIPHIGVPLPSSGLEA